MNLRVDHPELLWLLLLIVPIAWLGWKRLTTVEPARRYLAIALRVGVLALLVAMLAGLRAEQHHTDLTVIAVVDQSPSMSVFGQPPVGLNSQTPTNGATRTIGQAVRDYLQDASDQRGPDDRLGLVTYDAQPTVRVRPSNTETLDPGTDIDTREGTNTAQALEWAMAAKTDADTALRLVLVSDGNDTTGDALAAARAAAAAGVVIDVLPIDYKVGEEVMVEGVYTPVEAREGQTVAVRVVLRGTTPAKGRIQLLHDRRVIDLNAGAEGTGLPITPEDWSDAVVLQDGQDDSAIAAGGRYVLVKQIDVPIANSGANRFEAIFEADTQTPLGSGGAAVAETGAVGSQYDSVAVNNRAQSFTLVAGQGRVLVVDNVGGESGLVLPRALAERKINLDVVTPSGFPLDTAELTRYDAVVFQNVPAEMITGQQQTMLARYVNDLGGGFVMIGGPDSFGAGGWTNSIIDRSILPVACEIPSQTILPSGALAIVIDRSGSMGMPVTGSGGRTQLDIATEAAALAIQTLYPHDVVGVVGFDSFAEWVVPLQKAKDLAGIAKLARLMQEGGGTSIRAGLERAYDGLVANTRDLRESSLKHIILLTDGGDSDNFLPLINQLNRANITLSTVGVGDGHDDQLLRALALKGGGEYHPIANPQDLPQIFIKESRTIRKNLIKEINFTPQRVNTGSPVMTGLGSVPSLNGLILTGPKYDRRIEMPLRGPEGEPLFAHWQVGLGKAAAWTSDATNRWATPWMSWGGYGDFWARTVRHISRPAASREAELTAAVDGDTLRVRLDTTAVLGDQAAASLRVQGKVLRPDGEIADITLNQVGPGIYEADAPAADSGSYILNLFLTTPGSSEPQFVAGGATRVPGEELRRFAPNTTLLREIAAATGGRVLDPADPVAANFFDPAFRYDSVSTRPLRWLLLPWLLAALLLDIANRRLAWDHRAIAGWARQKLTFEKRSAEQTRSTMDALKNRRTTVKEKHAAAEPQAVPVAKPDTKRKFEAAPTAKVHDNFAEAVGGAGIEKKSATITIVKEPEPDEEESSTNRLLAAKRRAREKHQ